MKEEVFRAFLGNFVELTDVQKKCIEKIEKGKNILVISGTGTGKTEAVLAPLISNYIEEALSKNYLTWLYITPTKALVNDIYRRVQPKLSNLYINVARRHGDKDETKTKKPIHILITTPESLDILLSRNKKWFRQLKAVIIDEVHFLYNNQRGLQTSILVQRLKKEVEPNNLQIACLSATALSPKNTIDFFFGNSINWENVVVPIHKEINLVILKVDSPNRVIHFFENIIPSLKKILVFVNSRRECDSLIKLLSESTQLKNFLFIHHSSLSKQTRENTERNFNYSQIGICVATSTLELGIDIGDIDCVVLYSSTSNISSFLQRVGRGNRKSNKNNVICLIPPDTRTYLFEALLFYTIYDLAIEGIIECYEPMKLYGAVAQQSMSIITSNKGDYTKVESIFEPIKFHSHLGRETVEKILIALCNQCYIKKHDFKYKYGAGENLFVLYDKKLLWSNLPKQSQEISVIHGDSEIGQIPKDNLLKIKKGTNILFAGKCWRVMEVYDWKIIVEHSSSIQEAIEIEYKSEYAEKEVIILNRLLEYLKGKQVDISVFQKSLRDEISQFLENSPKIFKDNVIPTLKTEKGFIYLTLAGQLCNFAISKWFNVESQYYDDIVLYTSSEIGFSKLNSNPNAYTQIMSEYFSQSSLQTLYQQLIPFDLQIEEFLQKWLCNPEYQKVICRLKHSSPQIIQLENINKFFHFISI